MTRLSFKIAAAISLCAALAAAPMAGCSKVNIAVQDVIAGCVKACSFVPELKSVEALLSAAPWLAGVDAGVTILCDAFKAWEEANPPAPQRAGVHEPAAKHVSFTVVLKDGTPLEIHGVSLRH